MPPLRLVLNVVRQPSLLGQPLQPWAPALILPVFLRLWLHLPFPLGLRRAPRARKTTETVAEVVFVVVVVVRLPLPTAVAVARYPPVKLFP